MFLGSLSSPMYVCFTYDKRRTQREEKIPRLSDGREFPAANERGESGTVLPESSRYIIKSDGPKSCAKLQVVTRTCVPSLPRSVGW